MRAQLTLDFGKQTIDAVVDDAHVLSTGFSTAFSWNQLEFYFGPYDVRSRPWHVRFDDAACFVE